MPSILMLQCCDALMASKITNVRTAPQFRVSSFDVCPVRRLSDELASLLGRSNSAHKRNHVVCVMEEEVGLAHELTDSSKQHRHLVLYHQYQSIAKRGEEKRTILHGPRLPAQDLQALTLVAKDCQSNTGYIAKNVLLCFSHRWPVSVSSSILANRSGQGIRGSLKM